jgi:hypothetical protein
MDLELLCSPGSSLAKILLFIPNKQGNLKTTSIVITKTGTIHLIIGDLEKKRYSFEILQFLAIIDKLLNNLFSWSKSRISISHTKKIKLK